MTKRSTARRQSRNRVEKPAKIVDRLLISTSDELVAAKALLKQKKTRAKRARGKAARDNAKRAAKLVKKTIKSIEDHQDLLLQEKKEVQREPKISPAG